MSMTIAKHVTALRSWPPTPSRGALPFSESGVEKIYGPRVHKRSRHAFYAPPLSPVSVGSGRPCPPLSHASFLTSFAFSARCVSPTPFRFLLAPSLALEVVGRATTQWFFCRSHWTVTVRRRCRVVALPTRWRCLWCRRSFLARNMGRCSSD